MTVVLLFLIVAVVTFQMGRQVERKFGPKQMRHHHAWEIVEQRDLPSASEIAQTSPTKMIAEIRESNRTSYAPNTNSAMQLARRQVIVHRRCSLCGEEEVIRV